MEGPRPSAWRDFAEDPDLPLVLDQLAHRYHTDPASVLLWDPERLGIALVCLRRRDDHLLSRTRGGGVQAVFLVNG